MTKARYGPQDRARALALAEVVGPSEAARRLGMKVATVTGWRSKQKGDPEAFEFEIEIGETLLAEATGALTLAELEAQQRRTSRHLDEAMEGGRSRAAKDLAVVLGVLSDKVDKRRLTEPEDAGRADRVRALVEGVQAQFKERDDEIARLRAELGGRGAVALPLMDVAPVETDYASAYAVAALVANSVRSDPAELDRTNVAPEQAGTLSVARTSSEVVTFADGTRRRLKPGSRQHRIGGPR